MRQYRYASILMTLIILLFIITGCGNVENKSANTDSEPKSHTYFIFDTIVTLRVFDNRMEPAHFTELEALLNEIDREMNRQRQGSELDMINQKAGIEAVPVSAETYHVIRTALQYAEDSQGKFDPTIGPLVSLWGIGSEAAAVPDANSITQALELTNYNNVMMDDTTPSVKLLKEGMSLDLGSIAKGYAADVIADYLKERDMNSAIIDLGGNIIALGEKPSGSPWTIGIQAPDKQRGNHLGLIKVKDKTIVTSGVYERFFEENNVVYHHIFDSTTGYPISNHLLSVTIITQQSIDADALSTTVFALGLQGGLSFIEKREGIEAIFVTEEKEIHMTSGLQGNFELTNKDYSMAKQ